MTNLRFAMLILVVASGIVPTHAQQPAAPEKAPAAAKPAAAAPAPAAKAPAIAPQNELVVRAILGADPQKPAELLRAIKILVDLGEPASAKPLLTKLLDLKADDSTLAGLVDQFGSSVFLRIAAAEALAPDAQKLASTALDAANRYARDEKRIAAEIARLTSANPEERDAAIAALRSGRDASVAALLAVLDEPARRSEHDGAAAALVALEGESLAPLTGAIAGAAPALQIRICEVLGELARKEAVDYLLAPALAESSPPNVRAAARRALQRLFGGVPDPRSAAARLDRAARGYYDRPAPDVDAPPSEATLFYWDAARKRLTSQTIPASDANLALAARLAAEARRLLPDDAELRRLHLTALAEGAAYQAGVGAPLPAGPGTAHDRLLAEGAAALDDLLAYDLAKGHSAAAAVAARLLGEAGNREILYRHNPQPSPLADALTDRDRRVRFAALEAVLKLEPREPFPGAGRVVEALSFFVGPSAAPRALVADPQADEAGRLAALLAELGYESDIAIDPRGVEQLVAAGGDYELLLVDAALAVPISGHLVQQLRRDARTAHVPLAVVAANDERRQAEHALQGVPGAAVFVSPLNPAGLQVQLDRLMRQSGRGAVPPAERLRQTTQALAWLKQLTSDAPTQVGTTRRTSARQPLYDLRRLDQRVITGLGVPQLAPAAAAALAHLGTQRSQRALVDLASRQTQPVALRQAAAAAFRENLVRFGPLLTTEEINRQYDRYNASEKLDKPTQELLGSILDAIEARAAAAQLADDPTRETATDANR